MTTATMTETTATTTAETVKQITLTPARRRVALDFLRYVLADLDVDREFADLSAETRERLRAEIAKLLSRVKRQRPTA